MATRSQARLFAQLIAEYEPRIRTAFMASVVDLHANVDWGLLLEMLTAQNLNGAISALNIDDAAWADYSAVKTDIYSKAGAATASQIKQAGIGGVGIRFRMTDPNAQDWISRFVGEEITRFTNEQINVAREVIGSGFSKGYHPHTIATDLAGRVSPYTGIREGGVVGLDTQRAKRLQAITDGMRTPDGVQDLVIEHQDGTKTVRYKVNKATEKRILAAYEKGEAVPKRHQVLSESQYANALLKDRAETIARTETANSVLSGRDQQWQQLASSGQIDRNAVIKTWQHRRGASLNYRADHLAMSGTSVVGLDTPFEFPDGARLMYPHDPKGGAAHVINCGCDVEYRLDHSVGLE